MGGMRKMLHTDVRQDRMAKKHGASEQAVGGKQVPQQIEKKWASGERPS